MKTLLVLTTLAFGSLAAPYDVEPTHGGPKLPAGCRIEWLTISSIDYVEKNFQECKPKTERKCYPVYRQECETIPNTKCETRDEVLCQDKLVNVCAQKPKTTYKDITSTQCKNTEVEVCEGVWNVKDGGNKVWQDRDCKFLPVTKCNPVTNRIEETSYVKECHDEKQKECKTQKGNWCTTEDVESCYEVKDEECHDETTQECIPKHTREPVSVRVDKPIRKCSGKSDYEYTPKEIKELFPGGKNDNFDAFGTY